MRQCVLLACVLAFGGGLVLAQGGRGGSIEGIVTGPDGAPVADAPVQAKSRQGDAVARAVTGSDGRYRLAALATGSYDLSIAMPCCLLQSFSQPNVALAEGQALRLDVRLAQGIALNTLGDDPGTFAAMVRKRSTISSKPVPRLPGGKPDLSGLWLTNADQFPEAVSALPWAAAVAKERIESDLKDAPHSRCLPGGVPTPASTPPFMAKFVHSGSLLVVLFEDAPGFRQVFLDGRRHPADPNPSWVGHSVGRWERDALVVDTVGYNDQSWILGAFPHTEMLHVIERYRRPDFGHLEVQVTYDDPGTFVTPVIRNQRWDLAPAEELIEYVCENNKVGNLVGR